MTSSAWLLSAAVPGRLARLGSFPFGDLEGCGRLSMSGVGTGLPNHSRGVVAGTFATSSLPGNDAQLRDFLGFA